MTDHKTEAVNYLIASKIDARDDDGLKPAIAQVHATLYLAEQQRIANLIALGLTGPEARRQIVEGLGL